MSAAADFLPRMTRISRISFLPSVLSVKSVVHFLQQSSAFRSGTFWQNVLYPFFWMRSLRLSSTRPKLQRGHEYQSRAFWQFVLGVDFQSIYPAEHNWRLACWRRRLACANFCTARATRIWALLICFHGSWKVRGSETLPTKGGTPVLSRTASRVPFGVRDV